jgi:hypothetical protein
MTFTEAAVAVLRQAGRPLHYKKITELAIETNLLSHVGKTPEVTMSARLAMLAKKREGDVEIVKVKPGVFGLKEFGAAVLAAASADGAEGEEVELTMHDLEEQSVSENSETAKASKAADVPEKPPATPTPGSQLFPDEDDDDEPILAGLDESRSDPKRGRRRRRRRPGRGGASVGVTREASGRERESTREAPVRLQDQGGRDRYEVAGDWQREAQEDDLIGKSLSDAVYTVMEGSNSRQAYGLERIAQQLVQKGRLQGEPGALLPTVAAALRADNALQVRMSRRNRFRIHGNRVWLTEWLLPPDALRAERQAERAAEQQQFAVRKMFLKLVRTLPLTGFAELVASWLNAEGVTSVRAVRRPGSSANELHFAGVLHQGRNETHLAVVIRRDGQDVDKAMIEQIRGALHHYGQASMAWVITLGMLPADSRQEAAMPGVAPCTLFDGMEWAESLEDKGIGLSRCQVALSLPQFELLAALSGNVEFDTQSSGEEARGEGRYASGRRRRRGGRDFRRERGPDDNGPGDNGATSDADAQFSDDAPEDSEQVSDVLDDDQPSFNNDETADEFAAAE